MCVERFGRLLQLTKSSQSPSTILEELSIASLLAFVPGSIVLFLLNASFFPATFDELSDRLLVFCLI